MKSSSSSTSSELANRAEAQGLRVKGLCCWRRRRRHWRHFFALPFSKNCFIALLSSFFSSSFSYYTSQHLHTQSYTAQHSTELCVALISAILQAGCEWLNPVKYGLVSTTATIAAPLGCTSWPVVVVTAGHFWPFFLRALKLLLCTTVLQAKGHTNL